MENNLSYIVTKNDKDDEKITIQINVDIEFWRFNFLAKKIDINLDI